MIILMIPWAEICADRNLRDLPYKIETNRFDQIVMSPAYPWQGSYQFEVGKLLADYMTEGRVIMRCAVETTDGTKVPDVVWISRARYASYRHAVSLPIAPEICVEVLSNSNRTDEMLGKMQLYFSRGAEEVWLCDENGDMQFYWHDQLGRQPKSKKCPDFPVKIDWD